MIINKMASKIKKFVFYRLFLSLKFVEIVFVSSIISSHVITESSIILAKYLPFLQLHVEGFQIKFFHIYDVLHSHQH